MTSRPAASRSPACLPSICMARAQATGRQRQGGSRGSCGISELGLRQPRGRRCLQRRLARRICDTQHSLEPRRPPLSWIQNGVWSATRRLNPRPTAVVFFLSTPSLPNQQSNHGQADHFRAHAHAKGGLQQEGLLLFVHGLLGLGHDRLRRESNKSVCPLAAAKLTFGSLSSSALPWL